MTYTVSFETLGCRLNQAETAVFTRQFVGQGYRLVDDSAEADLCIINTCTLTHSATSKCRRLIRSIIRRNPDVCIAAVGCYAQTAVEELKAIAGLDYIVGTADKMRLPEIIPSPVKLLEPVVVRRAAARERFTIDAVGYYPSHTRANLKVQEGCNFVCSYCIIPRSRGPARSRDFDNVIHEAGALVDEGHRELIVTGINVGTYEDDGRSLVEMVDALDRIDGLERIRLSSIEPTTIADELLERMADGGKLCPYLHIPVQSGDDGVLARMRRKYTVGEYINYVDRVLERVQGIGLGTDIMVGFPGEDDAAFDKSCRVIERSPYTNVHVFSFSARKGTGAQGMLDHVPGDVIAERSREIHRIANTKKHEYIEKQKGLRLRVLFEEPLSNGYFVGFSDNYVKVGVPVVENEDLSNRIGVVEVTGVLSSSDRAGALLATGELIEIEPGGSGVNTAALSAHDTTGRTSN